MPPQLKAGVSEIDITPPLGVEMAGYGEYQRRVCTEVLDPLAARALWLEADGQPATIITADLCTLDLETRSAVAEKLRAACGLDGSRLMLCASHTHSGPSTQLMIGWGQRDKNYMAKLPARLAEVALAARAASVPAKVGAARTRISAVGVNREQPALAPTDTAAQLLRVDSADGKPLACLFNFGAHAVVRYPFTSRISADWPGLAAAYVRLEMPPAVPFFLQGPCGNINAHEMTFVRGDVANRQKLCDMRVGDVAQRFGDQVLPALKAIQTADCGELASAYKTIALPCVPPDRAALEETIRQNLPAAESMKLEDLRPLHRRIADETPEEIAFRKARFAVDAARHQLALLDRPPHEVAAPIHMLKLGPAVIVGWPGEVFVELGIELRQRSPFALTFVASFANHTVGYIPTQAAYESQGRPNVFGRYPTGMAPLIYGRLPFRPDVGRILVEETLALLNDLHG